MSQGITHFAVGATVTVVVVAFLLPSIRYPRTWAIVGGGWAMVPDASKLFESDATIAFHDSIWADLFWAHRTLDQLDPGDSTVWASVAVASFLAATMVAERRSYRVLEPVQTRIEELPLLDRE